MIKGTHIKKIKHINTCAANQGASKYIKQLITMELKTETDKNTIRVGDLSTPADSYR